MGECFTSLPLFVQVCYGEPYNWFVCILIIFTHHLVYHLGLLLAESNSVVVGLSLMKRGLAMLCVVCGVFVP